MAGWLLPRSSGRLGLGAKAPLGPWLDQRCNPWKTHGDPLLSPGKVYKFDTTLVDFLHLLVYPRITCVHLQELILYIYTYICVCVSSHLPYSHELHTPLALMETLGTLPMQKGAWHWGHWVQKNKHIIIKTYINLYYYLLLYIFNCNPKRWHGTKQLPCTYWPIIHIWLIRMISSEYIRILLLELKWQLTTPKNKYKQNYHL
jgi:hypothetical protein